MLASIDTPAELSVRTTTQLELQVPSLTYRRHCSPLLVIVVPRKLLPDHTL
jgi:hypothetical protein